MTQRTWLITGISSGFGRQLAEQLLARGNRVIGTIRKPGAAADLEARYTRPPASLSAWTSPTAAGCER